MKNFKIYLSAFCMIFMLLPLQAQKTLFEKNGELSVKMLAPNAEQLRQTFAKQQGNLLRSQKAAGQSVDLGNGLHLLPEDIDPESTVVSYTITSDQMANLPSIWGDLLGEISNRVYEKFNDDFDCLFFVLDRESWDYADLLGFYGINIGISNNVTGIGMSIGSNASSWGSAGKLKSAMFFPSTQMFAFGPALHEFCHNWAAFICPTFAPDGAPWNGGHWGLSNAGGQLGGFKYARVVEENCDGVPGKTLYQASMFPDTNPDGSFVNPGFGLIANGGNSVPYSDIELYLMGMKSAQELRDANFHLDIYSGSQSTTPALFNNGCYFYSDKKTSYTIDDIIALVGERVPNAAASQKQFKVLTIAITEEANIPRYAYSMIPYLRWFSGFPEDNTVSAYNFSKATNGIGSLVTTNVKNSLKSFVGGNVTGVSLDKTTISMPVNTTQGLTATVSPSDAGNKNVSWSSSNESVATVSTFGIVTALSEGKTTITVTTENGGFSATCEVTVTPALSDFEVVNGVLVAYHGTSFNVVIPDNLGITEIGSGAFYNNRNITSVSIPEGITKIGNEAFNACRNLTSIVIPNTVTEIGDYAFSSCALISIVIPKSVKSIGNALFQTCNSLTSINVDAENPVYSSKDGVLYNKNKTILLAYPAAKGESTFEIPNTVTEIGKLAFDAGATSPYNSSKLTSVIMPNSVKIIREYAFASCPELTSITISNSLETIENGAFARSYKLASITIPASVQTIGIGVFDECVNLPSIDVSTANPVYLSEDGVLYNKGKTVLYAYPAGKSETAFDIPNTVREIVGYAFGSCRNLDAITIPNSVQTIGAYAISNCDKLTSIDIPGSVTAIGQRPFFDCDMLRHVFVHWKTPLILSPYTLETYYFYTLTLHVPYGTKALYEAANEWKNFGTIVEQEPVHVTGVSLDITSLSLDVNATKQLTATVSPSEAADQSVTWSSSNASIASVNSSGLVTANAAGTATITVKTNDGGKTDACSITVNAITYTLTVNSGTGSGVYTAGAIVPIVANTAPAGQEFDKWMTSAGGSFADANSATTNFTMPANNTTVTATYKNLPVVNAQTPTISLQPQSATVDIGESVTLSVTASVTDGGTLTYQWYKDGAAISGATGSSYIPSTATAGTSSYYVVVTNTNNSVNGTKTANITSSTATVTVSAIPVVTYTLTVNNGSGGGSYEAGTVVNISANTAPAGQSFDQWTGDIAGVANVTTASTTYTMGSANATVTATYKTIPIVNAQTPVITSQPQSATVNVGDAVSLLVAANVTDGGTLTYQWYQGGAAISGATGSSFSPSTATAGTQSYYVIITNTNNSVNGTKTATVQSGTATVTVSAIPVVTYTLTVNNGSGGGSYEAGTIVNISANTAPAGQSFDRWTGDIAGIANANAVNTTYTMGSANATVTATYKLNLSSNATLGSLTVSAGTLTPAFNPDITNYTIEVENDVAIIVVSATSSDGKATVSGTGEFALNVGENTIQIPVTAEDGTTKIYTIMVTRKQYSGIEKINTGIKVAAENSSILIESGIVMTSVKIYNSFGQLIRLIKVNDFNQKIDNLPRGVLIANISLKGGEKSEIRKVLIK